MNRRVASIPNYAWPSVWLSRGYAPWRWLAASIFHSARLLGRIASIINLNRRAIALIRTDGAGDAILFEPALRSLARHFDGYAIDLWAPAGACHLLEAHPVLRKCVVVPRGFKDGNGAVFWSLMWRARLGYALGRNAYAVAIYPPDDGEPLGAWVLASIRAGEKWLNGGSTLNQFDWQQEWSRQFATRLLKPRPTGGHELLRNAAIAEQWGSSIATARPDLPLSARAMTYAGVHVGAARHAVRRARASGLIGIIPAGAAAINQYPLEKFADTLRQLWESHQLLPALLGGKADEVLLNKLSRLIADIPHHRFPLDHDISVAAAIVSRLDGLISVDTGLAHAAATFDVPSVVLVTGGMPDRFWPWPITTRTITLNKPMPCAGCNYRCTQEMAMCITDISPQWIVEALLRARRSSTILQQQSPSKEYRHAG